MNWIKSFKLFESYKDLDLEYMKDILLTLDDLNIPYEINLTPDGLYFYITEFRCRPYEYISATTIGLGDVSRCSFHPRYLWNWDALSVYNTSTGDVGTIWNERIGEIIQWNWIDVKDCINHLISYINDFDYFGSNIKLKMKSLKGKRILERSDVFTTNIDDGTTKRKGYIGFDSVPNDMKFLTLTLEFSK
jgi:hypothetical protein